MNYSKELSLISCMNYEMLRKRFNVYDDIYRLKKVLKNIETTNVASRHGEKV